MQKPIFKAKFKKLESSMFNKIKHLIKNCNFLGVKYIIFPLVDNSSIQNKHQMQKLIFLKKNRAHFKKI